MTTISMSGGRLSDRRRVVLDGGDRMRFVNYPSHGGSNGKNLSMTLTMNMTVVGANGTESVEAETNVAF